MNINVLTLLGLGIMTLVLFVGWRFEKQRTMFASVVTLIAFPMLIASFYLGDDYFLLVFSIASGLMAGAMEVWHSVWRRRRREGK